MGKKLKIALCVIVLIVLFFFIRSHLSYSDGENIELDKFDNSGYLDSNGNYTYNVELNFKGMPTDYQDWTINSTFKDASGTEVGNEAENCTSSDFYFMSMNTPTLVNVTTVTVKIKNPNGEVKFNKDIDFNMSKVSTTPPDTSSSSSASNTTSSNDSSSSISPGQVKAGKSTTIHFYSLNEPAAKSGYDAAIVVGGTPYYIGVDNAKALESYSSTFDKGTNAQYAIKESNPEYEGKISFLSFNIKPKNTYDNGAFELSLDKELSFDWKTGEVGLNPNAKIITKIYDSSGNEL